MLLGCIADDFTGGTDLASTLASGGMRVVQTIGIPQTPLGEVDAVVVALKSRTAPRQQAVNESLEALRWLQEQGCRQYFFKYCSTFDSTPAGNIGPVTDALMSALRTTFTIACPAYPENGRTVYLGHLFVGDRLLSESGMQNHPLTPMTDANLVRVLQAQTERRVGLIGLEQVAGGPAAIQSACAAATAAGTGIAIVDAVCGQNLVDIGTACAELVLLTGGSGAALGLPDNFRRMGLLESAAVAPPLPATGGPAAIIAGSCSTATNAQVAHWLKTRPGWRLEVARLLAGHDVVNEALAWARGQQAGDPLLIYATSPPDERRRTQAPQDGKTLGQSIEHALAEIAAGLAAAGTRQFVIAGGETSGAVVRRLGVHALRIGPVIDPGVPWTSSLGPRPLSLALKSGNFGTVDFFEKSLARLQ